MAGLYPKFYVLRDKRTFAVDLQTWAREFQKANRRVATTDVGTSHISTVFLGLDHNYFGGDPLLFETIVFGGPLADHMDRYSTWEQAERGHKEIVAKVKEAVARIDAIKKDAGAQ